MSAPRSVFRLSNVTVLFLGFSVLAALLLGVLAFLQRQATDYQDIRQSMGASNGLYRLFIALQDAETGQRGYLLTGNTSYLAPYTSALPVIDDEFRALGNTFNNRPAELASIAALRSLFDQKLSILRVTIDLRRAGNVNEAVALVDNETGRILMDRLRARLNPLIDSGNEVLETRFGFAEQAATWLRMGAVAAIIFAVSLALIAVAQTKRQLAEIISGRNELLAANEKLLAESQHGRNLTDQLRQSQKMEAIGQLTGGLGHDFNNMLAVIVSSLSLIKRRIARGDNDIERYIDSALDGAARAATLTHRLLAFSRQQPLAPVSLDPNKMVAGMAELLRRTLSESVQLETVLAGDLWRTLADPSQLENSILNLAVNARDAMQGGGKLTIETSNAYLDEQYAATHIGVTRGQYVLIAVTDTGAGINSDIIEKIFFPFFTTKPTGKGTGLGLSQVYGFVKQSGGHVTVYSELKHGTTIKVYLPRSYGLDDVRSAPVAPVEAAPTGSFNESILVVEDDDRVRQLTVDALRELGYAVLHADGGAAALHQLDALANVDLLFTDIVMPEVNGRTLAEQALKIRPGLKILFTTGYAPNAVIHNATLEPGEDLISKPFSIEQLARKVREILDRAATPLVTASPPQTGRLAIHKSD